MKGHSYRAAYIAAMDAATAELDGLFEEAARLRSRMEKINSVVTALKPLLVESDSAPSQHMNSEMSSSNQHVNAGVDLVLA